MFSLKSQEDVDSKTKQSSMPLLNTGSSLVILSRDKRFGGIGQCKVVLMCLHNPTNPIQKDYRV
jgi:hypothetical protein